MQAALSLLMTLAFASSPGSNGDADRLDVERRNLGISCGMAHNTAYCFPTKLLWGFHKPGESFGDGSFTLEIPIPQDQMIDCVGNFGDQERNLSMSVPYPGDTIEKWAERIRTSDVAEFSAPSGSTIWNGLDCFKTGGRRPDRVCIVDEQLAEQGMTIIRCDTEGSVPVPHCNQKYFTHGLKVETSYRLSCGVHWRTIQKDIDSLLDAGAAAARLKDRAAGDPTP